MAAEKTQKVPEDSVHSNEKPDTSSNATNEPAAKQADDDNQSVVDGTRTGWALGAILLACYLAMFLVALVSYLFLPLKNFLHLLR
jgi:hypothetical protein